MVDTCGLSVSYVPRPLLFKALLLGGSSNLMFFFMLFLPAFT
ncbi:hypothetical protein [Methanobrevibacter curvatus]|nr:hypothetical protein [Methanobrevibacter curvatus]